MNNKTTTTTAEPTGTGSDFAHVCCGMCAGLRNNNSNSNAFMMPKEMKQ